MNDKTAKADPVRALIAKWRQTADALSPADPRSYSHAVGLRACADDLEAALAQQAGAEPVAFQVRRPTALMNQWEPCTEEFFRDTLRTGRYGGFLNGTTTVETRALFDHAPQPAIPSADRQAIRMLVAAGYLTEAKADEALQLAHGFTTGELGPAPQPAIPEGVRRAIYSKDMYQVLMDVQNGIDSPALMSLANGAIRQIDAARALIAQHNREGQ